MEGEECKKADDRFHRPDMHLQRVQRLQIQVQGRASPCGRQRPDQQRLPLPVRVPRVILQRGRGRDKP